jgi:hypothetical protein
VDVAVLYAYIPLDWVLQADPSFGIPPEIEEGDRGMIGDRLEESRRALVASPSKIKEYNSYNQSYILDIWY